MNARRSVVAIGKRRDVRLALAISCTVACGSAGCVEHHISYFEEMTARMPESGQLRMHSQLWGLSASYIGPGRGTNPAKLVRAHFENDELTLSLDSPVRECESIKLSLFASVTDRKGKTIRVSNLFDATPVLLATDSYGTVITVQAKKKQPYK